MISVLVSILLSGSVSFAQSTEAEEAEAPPKEPLVFELGLRARSMSVPNGIMNIFFYNDQAEGWPLPDEDRPSIQGIAYGLEFVVIEKRSNHFVWVEWIDSTMEAGYWDDVEVPADHDDGRYIVPSNNFGLIAFGYDFGHEVTLLPTTMTNGIFGMSFLVGGGIGLGAILGQLEVWEQGGFTDPAYLRYIEGEPSDGPLDLPSPVWPLIDFNIGLRFNFGDVATLRFEGGLHTMLYFGGSLGIRF